MSDNALRTVPVPSFAVPDSGNTSEDPAPTAQAEVGTPGGTASAKPSPGEFALTPGVPSGSRPAERKRASRLSEDKRFKIFSGSANRPLTEEISRFLGVPLGETRLQRFSDGEIT